MTRWNSLPEGTRRKRIEHNYQTYMKRLQAKIHRVELKSGVIYTGRIVKRDFVSITLETQSGEKYIMRSDIARSGGVAIA